MMKKKNILILNIIKFLFLNIIYSLVMALVFIGTSINRPHFSEIIFLGTFVMYSILLFWNAFSTVKTIIIERLPYSKFVVVYFNYYFEKMKLDEIRSLLNEFSIIYEEHTVGDNIVNFVFHSQKYTFQLDQNKLHLYNMRNESQYTFNSYNDLQIFLQHWGIDFFIIDQYYLFGGIKIRRIVQELPGDINNTIIAKY